MPESTELRQGEIPDPLRISREVDPEFLEHLHREKLDQPELPGER